MQGTFVNLCYTMENHAIATMMTYFGSTDHGLGTEVSRGRGGTSSKNRLESPLIYIYIYIYIYIFTNLISTSVHGTRKNKKKTLAGTRDKSILNHRPGETEKIFRSKRKKRPTSSDPLKKIKVYAVSGQKKTKKPSANPAMLQLLKCSTPDNGANYQINLNRESKIFY